LYLFADSVMEVFLCGGKLRTSEAFSVVRLLFVPFIVVVVSLVGGSSCVDHGEIEKCARQGDCPQSYTCGAAGFCEQECKGANECPIGSFCSVQCGLCIRNDLLRPATCFPGEIGLSSSEALQACVDPEGGSIVKGPGASAEGLEVLPDCDPDGGSSAVDSGADADTDAGDAGMGEPDAT
jgi:hypothetical protein